MISDKENLSLFQLIKHSSAYNVHTQCRIRHWLAETLTFRLLVRYKLYGITFQSWFNSGAFGVFPNNLLLSTFPKFECSPCCETTVCGTHTLCSAPRGRRWHLFNLWCYLEHRELRTCQYILGTITEPMQNVTANSPLLTKNHSDWQAQAPVDEKPNTLLH